MILFPQWILSLISLFFHIETTKFKQFRLLVVRLLTATLAGFAEGLQGLEDRSTTSLHYPVQKGTFDIFLKLHISTLTESQALTSVQVNMWDYVDFLRGAEPKLPLFHSREAFRKHMKQQKPLPKFIAKQHWVLKELMEFIWT